MAEYDQPEFVDQRLRYFDGQFLREQDFIDEQRYLLDRMRRLARAAHTSGIIEGLAVTPVANAARVRVDVGTALDRAGRLLVRADATDTLDLQSLVDPAQPVTLLVTLSYAQHEAGATDAAGSPRWHERPALGARPEFPAPTANDGVVLARLTLSAAGAVALDQSFTAPRSGLAPQGKIAGPDGQPAQIDGTLVVDGSVSVTNGIAVQGPAYLHDFHTRGTATVLGIEEFDSTAQLRVTNGSGDFGRANLVITGRLQSNNDAWTFGSGARNSIVFATNEAASGEAVAEAGTEQFSIQLNSLVNSLGILTRTARTNPVLTIDQAGHIGIGTDSPAVPLEVNGDAQVNGLLGAVAMGRWNIEAIAADNVVHVRVQADSLHNVIAFNLPDRRVPAAVWAHLPDDEGWCGELTILHADGGFGDRAQLVRQGTDPIPGGRAGALLVTGVRGALPNDRFRVQIDRVWTLRTA